jgi:hypothetical protein
LQSAPIDEIFVNNYMYDALEYCIDILKKLIDSYNAILKEPTTRSTISFEDKELYDKKLNILRYEIIARVCHYAENLGAFGYAFMKSDQIKDVYNLVCNYKVNWVVDFYDPFLHSDNVILTDLQKARIKRVFAYPQPTTKLSKRRIDSSIVNIKKLLSEIGSVYIGVSDPKFKESYNSYKHGYRILSSKDNKNKIEVIIYVTQDGRLSYIPVDHKSMSIILDIKKYCRILLEIMLTNNRVRNNLARRGISESSAQIAFVYKQHRRYKIVHKISQVTIKNKQNSKRRSDYLIR